MRILLLALAFALAACAPSAAPASSAPASAAPATFEEFAVSACDAFEALFRAVGNPDTGSASELSAQLDEAIQRGDPAEANRIAEAMLNEIARGEQAASAAAGWSPGAAVMSELNDVLVAYEAYVHAKQELSTGNAADPQAAFEAAGGVTSWQAMLEAAAAVVGARPAVPPHQCDGIPMGW